MINLSEARAVRVSQEWSRAFGAIELRQVGGDWYAFGAELPLRRLVNGHAKLHADAVQFSANLQSWFVNLAHIFAAV